MNPYFYPDDTPWTELGDAIRRKVAAHTPQGATLLDQFSPRREDYLGP